MIVFSKLFALAIVSFGVLDGVWLGVVMGGFYRRQLWALARTSGDALAPNWGTALLVYPLLALGIVAFALPKVTAGGSALVWGALFGLVVYGTYDLTNQATLRDYSLLLAAVDMGWGMCVSAIVTLVVSTADQWLRG